MRTVQVADGDDRHHARPDPSSITATTYTSYATQDLAAATWGAAAERAGNTGRQMTYPQVTYATVGVTGDTINGFYVMNNGATICIGAANFDDLTADHRRAERHHQAHPDVRLPSLKEERCAVQ